VFHPTLAPNPLQLLAISSGNPEEVKVLIDAFEDNLRALELVDREDPLTIMVAKIIVELAKEGERDATHLRDLALQAVAASRS